MNPIRYLRDPETGEPIELCSPERPETVEAALAEWGGLDLSWGIPFPIYEIVHTHFFTMICWGGAQLCQN